jgi:hypothetical protein
MANEVLDEGEGGVEGARALPARPRNEVEGPGFEATEQERGRPPP